MNFTRVRRIDITNDIDLTRAIQIACDIQLGQGFRLASSFESQGRVILIFQKADVVPAGRPS